MKLPLILALALALALTLTLSPGTATGGAAQVASASTAATGMAENYTAVARGFNAVAWNPAVLGLASNRHSSFTLLPVRAATDLEPVTLGDLSAYSNTVVPANVKRDWLTRIANDGGQTGSGGGDVSWLAIQLGPLAVHASTTVRAAADLAPGIAELILFGNVGENGEARSLDLSGSQARAHAWSSIAASFGFPVPLPAGRLAFGITGKYVIGHALALGENSNGAATTDPLAINVDFPLVHTDFENGGSSGRGLGFDVGAAFESGDLTLAAAVQNVANTFQWNPDRLRYRPLAVNLDQDTTTTQTEDMPFDAAPASLRNRVEDLTFRPTFAAGAAYRASRQLLLAADVRISSVQGLGASTARHAGGGIEFRPVQWLPLRAGAATIAAGENANGYQFGVGIGLDIGRINLGASMLRRSAGRLGGATSFMITMIESGQ